MIPLFLLLDSDKHNLSGTGLHIHRQGEEP